MLESLPPGVPSGPRLRVQLALLLCVLACACSGSNRPHTHTLPVNTDDGGEDDVDSGRQMHGDAAADGGNISVGTGDMKLCEYVAKDDLFVLADHIKPDVLSAAALTAGYGVVYQRDDGALFAQAIARTGKPAAAVTVVAASENVASPRVIVSSAGFLLGYRATIGGNDTLIVRDMMNAQLQPNMLTGALSMTAAAGEPWALVATDDGALVAWLDGASATPTVQGLTPHGVNTGAVTTLDALTADKPARLQLSRTQTGSLLLAYRKLDANGDGAVFGQSLTTTTHDAEGAPVQLSKNAVADAPFALAARSDSSGLLYPALDGNVRQALKLRRIDAGGRAEGPVLNLADSPRVVRDGSIAAFGRGYAVLYRELPSLGVDSPAIRIAFVNQFGSVVYDAKLADTDDAPGGTAVATTAMGAGLVVSWIATDGVSTQVHALRMSCPGALVLCGGTPD